MTDPELIAKKLAAIETYLHELRTLARVEVLSTDIREERFVEPDLESFLQAVRSRLG